MLIRVGQWLALPQFENVDKQRDGHLIHAFLMILLLSAGVYNVGLLFTGPNLGQIAIAWAATLAILGVLAAIRRGHVAIGSYALPLFLWLILTFACFNRGGVTNTAFSGYLFVIIFATFLGGHRLGWFFAAISGISGLVMLLAATNEWLPLVEVNLVAIWGMNILFGIELVLLQSIARRYAESALNTARENQAALEASNRELQQQINERQRAERDRDRILDLSLDIIGVASMDGYFKRLNPAAERILGYTTQELMQFSTDEITHPDDVERSLAEAAKFSQGLPSIDFENRFVCKDGSIVWLSWRVYPADNMLYFVARDVTANKEAEAQRVQIEMEKCLVEMKHDFISMVSHEFRTPLAVIRSSKDILERYGERLSAEGRSDHLKTIDKQITYMLDMLQQVLLVNQFSSGTLPVSLEWLDVDQHMRVLVEQVQLVSDGSHVIRLDAIDTLGKGLVDQHILGHIFTNLIGNAMKYSPPGSEVILEIQRQGDQGVFRVRDCGIGIPEDALKHLYEPFYRADNARQISGTGLGMTIVKNGVDAHGGTIECESQVGVGTTFTVRIPLYGIAKSVHPNF